MQSKFILIIILFLLYGSGSFAQRLGKVETGSISKILISNGPKGPIQGGESAVTKLISMPDEWVYGSTKATWGGSNCHLFRTNGDVVEHLLNVTSELPGQTSIDDLISGGEGILFGGTSTYDEIFDTENNNYQGGHLFSFNIRGKKIKDLGIIQEGQGIRCTVLDKERGIIYCVTYPAGHLFSYHLNTGLKKDYGEVMKPMRVKDMGRVSWRGVPKVLLIDDSGTVYYSTYITDEIPILPQEIMAGGRTTYSLYGGGRIFRLAYGDEKPVFTGAVIPTQKGMDTDPLYENGIASAIRAYDGGFWCGTINDGFLFKFHPSTSTIINKGKAFQYWNLKSLCYGRDGKLYMLGGRDEDNSWLLSYDTMKGSIECLGWLDNTSQCNVIAVDSKGRILMGENLRHSFIWVYDFSQR